MKKSRNFPRFRKNIFFEIFFRFEKKNLFYFFSTPTQKFVRNPKIILRKPRDHFKDENNTNSKVAYTKSMILVTFGNVLRITALKFWSRPQINVEKPCHRPRQTIRVFHSKERWYLSDGLLSIQTISRVCRLWVFLMRFVKSSINTY